MPPAGAVCFQPRECDPRVLVIAFTGGLD